MTGERERGNAVVEGDCGSIDPICDIRVERERVVERGMLPGVPEFLVGRLREARIEGEVGKGDEGGGRGSERLTEGDVSFEGGEGEVG